jgi:hypothetical protein
MTNRFVVTMRYGVALGLGLLLSRSSVVFAQSPYKQIDVRNGGTIRGLLVLEGPAPRIEGLPVAKDADFCGKTQATPRLLLGKRNGIKNAVVFLEDIKQGKRFEKTSPVLVDQRRCEYSPHVTVSPFGSPIQIMNSDPVLHNVHSYRMEGQQTVFNIAQPIRGQKTTVKETQFKSPGIYSLTCDAGHPWMSAYIMVAAHPYYAVTDENGRFELKNVPPGRYRLSMWHPGVAVTKVEVEKGKPKRYTFEEAYTSTTEVSVTSSGSVDVQLALRPSDNVAVLAGNR